VGHVEARCSAIDLVPLATFCIPENDPWNKFFMTSFTDLCEVRSLGGAYRIYDRDADSCMNCRTSRASSAGWSSGISV